MANIRKQFNFRNGVQVDDDNLIVNPSGLVGIGTSVPTEKLDVRGNAKVVGLATVDQLYTPNLTAVTASITDLTLSSSIVGSGVSIGSGIITAVTGVVTYYGDGGSLLNLPTSQWLDIDAGLGFTSIYAQGYVGVGTDDPRFLFQVGGNTNTTVSGFERGVGISSEGHILATGIATASKFVGIGSDLTGLNASSIAYGTISNDRIPVLLNSKIPSDISISGVVTATSFDGDVTGNVTGNVVGNVTGNLTGNVTGTADLAEGLTGVPNIVVGSVTANSIGSTSITSETVSTSSNLTVGTHASVGTDLNVAGVTTTNSLHVGVGGTQVILDTNGRIGIGSATPSRPFEIITTGISEIELVGSESRIILAEEKSGVGIADSAGVIRYGNSDDAFELLNYTPGNFNHYLHAGGAGINTGRFGWIYGQNFEEILSLTYEGNLGVGITNPEHNLHVVGTSTVTGNSSVGGDLIVDGDLTFTGSINGTITLPPVFDGNVNSITGVSTFANVILGTGSSLGIGTDNPIIGLDARGQTGLFANVGIATDDVSDTSTLHVVGNALISNGVGIGTTSYDPLGAYIQINVPSTYLNDGHLNLNSNSTVGFNTTDPAAIFDFGNVGSATTRPVMVVPNIDNTTIIGIAQTPTGSIIFNTNTLRFQGYTGTAWVDFHS